MAATRTKSSIDALRASSGLATYTHSDYKYYRPEWDAIRDAIAGERRVKDMGTTYLPGLDVEYGTSYETYKSRAVYVNMVARTVLGMVGTVFRRPVKADNVSKDDQKNVTLQGLDLNIFAKKLTLEVCALGRVGVLVDMVEGSERPYFAEYVAENILSWRTSIVNGREVLTYVLLREISDETPVLDGTLYDSQAGMVTGGLRARYRVLLLENGVYKQRLYSWATNDTNPTFLGKDYKEIIPTRGGQPFDFIPMIIMGPLSPTPEVQKSPVYDITTLNYAHYRTSAQLEHGRYYTALPVYYVPVRAGQENGDYHVGPSVVWETDIEAKPGILEYYGTGLKSLTDSLTEKEEHIAQLGGRIMGIRPAATAESDNIFRMKQANEMSLLLNVTESISAALTKLMTWLLDWQRKSTTGVRIRLNQDFKALQIAARELRALALLYQEGILPIQEVYNALQQAEWIGDEVTFEEFKAMLENLENFPNQPDVEAMHEGYPDATSRLVDQQSKRKESLQESQAEMDRQHQSLIDQRRLDQQMNLQEQMFKQGLQTQQYEHEQQERMSTVDADNKIRVEKAKPKPKAAPARAPTARKAPTKK